jgi:hypothetical protein
MSHRTAGANQIFTGDGSGICVVAQILEWKYDIWNFWCEVARWLETQGQSLLLLSPYPAPGGATWPRVLPIPYWFGQYASGQASTGTSCWNHLLDADELYRSFLPPTRRAGIPELAAAREFIDTLLDDLDPDVVMSWAPPFPVSQLFLGEARRREIPAYGLELGFLPNTLMVDSHDIGFGSDLTSLPSVVSALAHHQAVPSVVDAMRLCHCGGVRSPHKASLPRTVLLLGSCPGFNLEPLASRQIQLASPWFESFEEAFTAMRHALPADTCLVARPHPGDRKGERFCRTELTPEQFASDGSVRELVERSDVVAVLGGTRTQIEALLMSKPLVLLSRTCLWGHGIAYEFSGENLSQLVDDAFARIDWPSRSNAGDRYLSFLAEHCLYGYAGAPVSRGAQDFAAFLGRFHLPGGCDPGPRLERFIERTAPLLGPYVCREVSRGIRPHDAVHNPYLDAQVVAQMLDAGVIEAAIWGAGRTGARIARQMQARGLTITAVVDPDPSRHGLCVEGVIVQDAESLTRSRTDAIVLATHTREDDWRRRLAALGLEQSTRLFSPTSAMNGARD